MTDHATFLVVLALAIASGCSDDPYPSGHDGHGDPGDSGDESTSTDDDNAVQYVLGSVVYTDSGRSTYVQVLPSLEVGHIDNDNALEVSGNGLLLAHGRNVWVGLAEEPTWIRYLVDEAGDLEEDGRVSFLSLGWTRIDYGNVIVDETTAVSVSGSQSMAVIWHPETMEIRDEVDLGHLVRDGYTLEVWSTTSHEGLVYIPGRWANWDAEEILEEVVVTVLDPATSSVISVAHDDRCASGGRVVFDADGIGYVMGDGRNYSWQMYARARGEAPPKNCLLRILPGADDFDPDFFHEIPALTGGPEAAGELETGAQGSGIGLVKMFDETKLPEGVEPVDFGFWEYPAFKAWRLQLADPPTAEEVEGLPYSTLGYEGSGIDGKLYTGESPDYATSEVYEIDGASNSAVAKFTMDGIFYGLFALTD